ncbi:MAG: DNA-directed RNA polymerase subunit D [Candidatus Micrarchaeota archaeon]
MQLEVLKDEGSRIQVHVKGASIALVNALRRAVISDLECFAIDTVDFYENNSVMFNEYLANRLGLIPLSYEESVAEDAQVSLSLNAEGPGMVYSRDLRSSDEKIRVFSENIPIIKLAADQKLRLEAFAIRGTAKQHAKFQCALASYAFYPAKGKVSDIRDADRDAAEGKPMEYKDGEFVFLVESFNDVPAKEQLKRAAELLRRKAEALSKEKELK